MHSAVIDLGKRNGTLPRWCFSLSWKASTMLLWWRKFPCSRFQDTAQPANSLQPLQQKRRKATSQIDANCFFKHCIISTRYVPTSNANTTNLANSSLASNSAVHLDSQSVFRRLGKKASKAYSTLERNTCVMFTSCRRTAHSRKINSK